MSLERLKFEGSFADLGKTGRQRGWGGVVVLECSSLRSL